MSKTRVPPRIPKPAGTGANLISTQSDFRIIRRGGKLLVVERTIQISEFDAGKGKIIEFPAKRDLAQK